MGNRRRKVSWVAVSSMAVVDACVSGAAEDASKSQRKERESLDMRLASAANVRLQELEAAKVAREEAERAKPRDPIDFPAIMEQNTSAGGQFRHCPCCSLCAIAFLSCCGGRQHVWP
jgi:hypothetical protein